MHRRPARKFVSKSVWGSYVRNFVFGTEDSLVSTVGMISGIAAAGTARPQVILSGIVLIVVEAFSMGIGSFLSEQSEEEYLNHKDGPTTTSITNGIIMFTSYIAAGIVPLAPYFLVDGYSAIWYSIFASILALGILGGINGLFFKVSVFQNSLKMSVLGGLAIGVGILIGQLISPQSSILLQ